mmetsp:Transcript_34366/g.110390  ORF Transcript_34366/g.110390 Transcript_34366/m.110390 type:complete len:208 (+) Transcript_34366:139-762(+)
MRSRSGRGKGGCRRFQPVAVVPVRVLCGRHARPDCGRRRDLARVRSSSDLAPLLRSTRPDVPRNRAGRSRGGARRRDLSQLLLLLLTAHTPGAAGKAVDTGTVRGWSSWSLCTVKGRPGYGPEWLTASNVDAQSAALARTLQPHGFDHVDVDSLWAADAVHHVDLHGRWTHNATRFPEGMRRLADTLHSRGQKLGLYLNPGLPKAAA